MTNSPKTLKMYRDQLIKTYRETYDYVGPRPRSDSDPTEEQEEEIDSIEEEGEHKQEEKEAPNEQPRRRSSGEDQEKGGRKPKLPFLSM